MDATLYLLHVPPTPRHKLGLDYLTHLPMSNGFDSVLIVVDRSTRLGNSLPCTESVTTKEDVILFLRRVYRFHGLPRVLGIHRDPKFANGFWQTLWRRLGT
jgi:hypothetical protein